MVYTLNVETSITFRGYRDEDFDQVWNLHEKALRHAGAFIAGVDSLDTDLKNIPKAYDGSGGLFVIAEMEDMIIGMGAIRRVDRKTAELKRMRVLPEYQGQGLGTRLLKHLEGKAKELGYKRLILDTSLKLEAAVHLYEKYGYREYKRGEIAGWETLWMEKEI